MCLTKELSANSNEKHFKINVYSISNNRSSSIQNLAQKFLPRLPQYCVNAQGQIYNIIYCIITVETIPLWTWTMTVNKFMFMKIYMLIYCSKYRIYFQILFCNFAYQQRVSMGEIFVLKSSLDSKDMRSANPLSSGPILLFIVEWWVWDVTFISLNKNMLSLPCFFLSREFAPQPPSA